jgi:hypothetical protein
MAGADTCRSSEEVAALSLSRRSSQRSSQRSSPKPRTHFRGLIVIVSRSSRRIPSHALSDGARDRMPIPHSGPSRVDLPLGLAVRDRGRLCQPWASDSSNSPSKLCTSRRSIGLLARVMQHLYVKARFCMLTHHARSKIARVSMCQRSNLIAQPWSLPEKAKIAWIDRWNREVLVSTMMARQELE